MAFSHRSWLRSKLIQGKLYARLPCTLDLTVSPFCGICFNTFKLRPLPVRIFCVDYFDILFKIRHDIKIVLVLWNYFCFVLFPNLALHRTFHFEDLKYNFQTGLIIGVKFLTPNPQALKSSMSGLRRTSGLRKVT